MGLEQGLEIKIVMEREGAVLGNGPKKKWNNFLAQNKSGLGNAKKFAGKLKKLRSTTIDFIYSFCLPKCT